MLDNTKLITILWNSRDIITMISKLLKKLYTDAAIRMIRMIDRLTVKKYPDELLKARKTEFKKQTIEQKRLSLKRTLKSLNRYNIR